MNKPTYYITWGDIELAVDAQNAVVGVLLPLNDGLPQKPIARLYRPPKGFKDLPINLMFKTVIEEEPA